MGKIAALIFTGVLGACFVLPLLGPGKMIPKGVVVASLISLVVLWALYLFKEMPLGWRIFLNIVFYFMFIVISLPVGVGSAIFLVADRPHRDPPVELGSGSKGRIAVVYHPGMSPLVSDSVGKMAKILAADGYAVTLMTANRQCILEQGTFKALVVSSPVYAGMTRPPLEDFLSANAPITIPTFALISGGGTEGKEDNLAKLGDEVKSAGSSLQAGAKVAQNATAEQNDGEIQSLSRAVETAVTR